MRNDSNASIRRYMKAIDKSRAFYFEYGEKMIKEKFPSLYPRVATGLVGHGSECYGFDDEISSDHDFETGFYIFVGDDVTPREKFLLSRAYDALIKEHVERDSLHSAYDGRLGVIGISDFYRRYTGSDGAPESLTDWLVIPSEYLAEAVNGEVFYDGTGEFLRIRDAIKNVPADVKCKNLARCLLEMAQSGQYNYSRCIRHGEYGAARLALNRFVDSASEAVFILNDSFMPYYKWRFRAMRNLPSLDWATALLELILFYPPTDTKEIEKLIESFCSKIAAELRLERLSDVADDFLEPHAYAVRDLIKDNDLRNDYI